MKLSLLAFFFAALAGSIMAVQGALNSALGKKIGLLEATLIVLLIGTLTALPALYLLGLGKGNLANLGNVPWYLYLGGVLIVIITYGVVASMPRLGVANATTAIVAAQILTAVLIDHFGLFGLQAIPFSWWKVAGLVLMAVGTRLMMMR
ncbi:MAG: DMT family transporter [Bacillota bacterium]